MKPTEQVAGGWALDKNGSATQYLNNIRVWYKLDQASFEKMWHLQRGKCGVCGQSFAHPWLREGRGVKPVIDHKHGIKQRIGTITQDQVRGLLCVNCNKLLGTVRESIHTLQGAANWLTARGVGEWEHEEQAIPAPAQRFDEVEVTELDGTKKIVRRYY